MSDQPLIRGCPFCGARLNLLVQMSGDAVRIACRCGATGPVAETFLQAATRWNGRAAEQALSRDDLSKPIKGVC